eukprot:6167754-Prymnesium_polylepis.1
MPPAVEPACFWRNERKAQTAQEPHMASAHADATRAITVGNSPPGAHTGQICCYQQPRCPPQAVATGMFGRSGCRNGVLTRGLCFFCPSTTCAGQHEEQQCRSPGALRRALCARLDPTLHLPCSDAWYGPSTLFIELARGR